MCSTSVLRLCLRESTKSNDCKKSSPGMRPSERTLIYDRLSKQRLFCILRHLRLYLLALHKVAILPQGIKVDPHLLRG